MSPRTLLVTGGAGFIGSNFILHYMKSHPDDFVINLDCLTYAGNLTNLTSIEANGNYHFIKADITDSEAVQRVFEGTYSGCKLIPDTVIHFAAESHVDRSIISAEPFVRSNVLGTQVLLDAARKNWNYKEDNRYRFVHISTDEVYGTLGETGFFTEDTPISPNSPYSASKAGSDLLVRAYCETHSFPALITRCSNNYGPFQFPEKLIPLMLLNILKGNPLPVYGEGKNIRDWLYVEDHCLAITCVLEKGKIGEVYNIGGNNEWKNIDIVQLICKLVDEKKGWTQDSKSLITFVKDRAGHDWRYAMDAGKISRDLGWAPKYTFEQGLPLTIDWYLNNAQWLEGVASGAYQDYYKQQYFVR